jgi:hypothetical protein
MERESVQEWKNGGEFMLLAETIKAALKFLWKYYEGTALFLL